MLLQLFEESTRFYRAELFLFWPPWWYRGATLELLTNNNNLFAKLSFVFIARRQFVVCEVYYMIYDIWLMVANLYDLWLLFINLINQQV